MREFWHLDAIPTEAPALIVPGGRTITYGELDARADQWRARLMELSGSRRALTALEFSTTPDTICAYLGALRAELPLLIAEPGQSESQLRLYRHWRPQLRIAGPELNIIIQADGTPDIPEPHSELRLLLSTSGSTGDPKLVRLSGLNIARNAAAIGEYLELTPKDRAITTLPLFYSYGLSVLNSYLAAGATLVLHQASVIEPGFRDLCREHGVTSLALVPHQFELLDRAGHHDFAGLRYITQAGGKLPADTVRRYAAMGKAAGWRLFVMYGQTEAAPRISYVPPESLPDAADTIGRAIPGGRLWIADETDREITGPGIAGELIYDGPNVMMGYAESPADLSRGPDLKHLRTGDIAERTKDGFFRIVGRQKRFVKLFGLRLNLDQLEAALREQGLAVHAVAVNDRLVLLHEDAAKGEEARNRVAEICKLPPDAIHISHLAELPLLASGKPDHQALNALAAGALRTAARRGTKASLAEIMKRATRSRDVMPGDSFTALGGDSLSYIQVQIALEERLGRIPEGWERMSLADLEMLEQATGRSEKKTIVDVDIVLRISAVILVIAQHASPFPLGGGTWMLVVLMGFSAARFQAPQIAQGRTLRYGVGMLYPILPLYYALLLAYGLFRDEVPASYIFLYANYDAIAPSKLLTPYWFVSLYAQIIVLLMAVSTIRVARQAIARNSWAAAAAVTAALLVVDGWMAVAGTQPDASSNLWISTYAGRGLLECLPLYLVGWMARSMKGRTQFIVTTLSGLLACILLIRSGVPNPGLVFATILLLAIDPRIALPSKLGLFLRQLAALTLFAYLGHEIVVTYIAFGPFEFPPVLAIAISVALTFAFAFAARRGFDVLERWIATFRSRQTAKSPQIT